MSIQSKIKILQFIPNAFKLNNFYEFVFSVPFSVCVAILSQSFTANKSKEKKNRKTLRNCSFHILPEKNKNGH